MDNGFLSSVSSNIAPLEFILHYSYAQCDWAVVKMDQ